MGIYVYTPTHAQIHADAFLRHMNVAIKATRHTGIHHSAKRLKISISRTRHGNLTSAMAQLIHFLLLAAVGICCCAALMEMSIPEEGERSRRAPEDNWPAIYPRSFYVEGGAYAENTNGDWSATDQIQNNRPVYSQGKGGRSTYKILYPPYGNKWEIDYEQEGTAWVAVVADHSTLFAPEV